MLDIFVIQDLCHDKNIAATKHAKNRLHERGITIEDVKSAIQTGEIIKQYEEDKPFPSCLLLGFTEQKECIHIIVSINNGYLYIITAYYPDENEWEIDFRTRKGSRL